MSEAGSVVWRASLLVSEPAAEMAPVPANVRAGPACARSVSRRPDIAHPGYNLSAPGGKLLVALPPERPPPLMEAGHGRKPRIYGVHGRRAGRKMPRVFGGPDTAAGSGRCRHGSGQYRFETNRGCLVAGPCKHCGKASAGRSHSRLTAGMPGGICGVQCFTVPGARSH